MTNPLQKIHDVAQQELRLLEARQRRLLDVGPDEESHVFIEWDSRDLAKAVKIRDCLMLLQPALCA